MVSAVDARPRAARSARRWPSRWCSRPRGVVTLNLISNDEPGHDRRQHRAEVPRGDGPTVQRADRHRPGAVRRSPSRSTSLARWIVGRRASSRERTDDRPIAEPPPSAAAAARAARTQPRLPRWAPGPGRRRWSLRRGRPAGAARRLERRPAGWSLAVVLFLVAHAALVAALVEGRRTAVDRLVDRADLDGVRARRGAAGLAALDGAQERPARRSTPTFLTYSMRNVVGDGRRHLPRDLIGTLLDHRRGGGHLGPDRAAHRDLPRRVRRAAAAGARRSRSSST